MQIYKLRSAIVGIARDADGHMKVITVPVGTETRVSELRLQSGMIDSELDGKPLSVFVQDLKARGDLVKGAEG